MPYAAGQALARGILDSLMSTTYFNASALRLIRLWVTGGATIELELALAEGAGLRGGYSTRETMKNRDRFRVEKLPLAQSVFRYVLNVIVTFKTQFIKKENSKNISIINFSPRNCMPEKSSLFNWRQNILLPFIYLTERSSLSSIFYTYLSLGCVGGRGLKFYPLNLNFFIRYIPLPYYFGFWENVVVHLIFFLFEETFLKCFGYSPPLKFSISLTLPSWFLAYVMHDFRTFEKGELFIYFSYIT